jgi:hypothetical protein
VAIALVSGQNVSTHDSSGGGITSLTVTFTNNPTTNNLVVVAGCTTSGSTGLSVSDANSNTYTATTSTPFNTEMGIWYLVAPSNASKSITLSWTSGATNGVFYAAEFSGAATASVFEADSAVSSGSGTAINTPSITTTNDGDLLFAITFDTSSNLTSTPAGSPWSQVGSSADSISGQFASEYFVQTTHGAQAVNYNVSASASWFGMVAAFKAGASAQPETLGNPIIRARQFGQMRGGRQIYG